MAEPKEWIAHCDISLYSQAHVQQDGTWNTVFGDFNWSIICIIFTCKSYMGGGEKKGDGVGEDEGWSKVWPEDGGGEDEEGAGEVDQVKAGQADHQAESMTDKYTHIRKRFYQ